MPTLQHLQQAREYLKYISHADVVALVDDLNAHETDFSYIKASLSACLNKQYQALPVANNSLKQLVRQAFCLMVNNYETGVYLYGARATVLTPDGRRQAKLLPVVRIGKLSPLVKLAFSEWEQEGDSPSLPAIQPQGKPIFKPEVVEPLFSILKHYFAPEQQSELLRILQTSDTATEKLLFLDSGNRLADTFKQLYEHGYIVGCQKQELNRWITDCFYYHYRNATKAFSADYVEKCVSKNSNPCMNPIIQIEGGKIRQVEAS